MSGTLVHGTLKISATKLRDLLAEVPDDCDVAGNDIRQLAIIRGEDREYVGYIDFHDEQVVLF